MSRETRNTPRKVQYKIRLLQKSIKAEILSGIKAFVLSKGGPVKLKGDEYRGYPTIYNDSYNAIILGIREVSVNDGGKIILVADMLPRFGLKSLPVDELLQLWETIERECVN